MMKDFLNEAVYGAKRSAIREFSRLAKETPGCIGLTLGEPDFDTPADIRAEVPVSLDAHKTHYIENNGLKALREKIAAFERDKNGMDYSADEVIVTSGATEGLFVSLFGILNPGDEVIVPQPAFVLYEEIIHLCRGTVVPLGISEDGFQIRRVKLEACLTERTKAILLNSPNNPSGTILNRESLDAVHDAVKDRNIFVITDDVYRQLIYTDDYHSIAEYRDLREKILLVQSFSKPYAMTGWRMGWLCMDASVKERLELIHQFLVVSTPAPFQDACIKALDQDVTPFVREYRRRRDFMLQRLKEMNLPVTEPEGAFYVFPDIRRFGLTSADFCRRMIQETKLAATPGSAFGCEGYIRLTYCYSDAELEEGMARLERFVKKLEAEQ